MAYSVRLWLETHMYWVRIPADQIFEIVVVHMQSVQRHGVCSAVYATVHYREPLKSFEKSRAYSRLRALFCRDITIIVRKVT